MPFVDYCLLCVKIYAVYVAASSSEIPERFSYNARARATFAASIMTPKARQQHEVQAGLDRGGQQGAGLHTTAEPITGGLCAGLEDGAATAHDDKGVSPEPAALIHQATTVRPAADRQRGQQQQQQSTSPRRDGHGPYGRSPSSCNRHLRRRARASLNSCNKPKALVDAEMEMALAGGSKVAEKAMRAVREANAQVCLANLEARKYCHNARICLHVRQTLRLRYLDHIPGAPRWYLRIWY